MIDKSVKIINIIKIALLFIGSAIMVYSCGDDVPRMNIDPEKFPTMIVDSMELKYSEDGKMSYRFSTPKMERYSGGDTLYMEFKHGVVVQTFNDSTLTLESELTANYGYFDEKREMWRVKGDVVAKSKDGKTLYTEELFWNQKEKDIFSNLPSTIVDGEEKIFAKDGFKADEKLDNIKFFNSIGHILIDTTTNVVENKLDSVEMEDETQESSVK